LEVSEHQVVAEELITATGHILVVLVAVEAVALPRPQILEHLVYRAKVLRVVTATSMAPVLVVVEEVQVDLVEIRRLTINAVQVDRV
jgi:hypothetical protein